MKTKRFKSTFLLAMLLALFVLPGCYVHDDCHYCGSPPPPPPPPPCTYGPDGSPGPAFFGVDWLHDQPDYLWTNNTAIPYVFHYGTYYNSYPGTYRLYYEGVFYDGCCPVTYYWDVNFVVWMNAGTAGGCGFVGIDGLPSYLMLRLSPTGPAEIRTNKTALPGTEMEVIRETATETEILYTKGDLNILVTYTKLEASEKDKLDPKGEITVAKK